MSKIISRIYLNCIVIQFFLRILFHRYFGWILFLNGVSQKHLSKTAGSLRFNISFWMIAALFYHYILGQGLPGCMYPSPISLSGIYRRQIQAKEKAHPTSGPWRGECSEQGWCMLLIVNDTFWAMCTFHSIHGETQVSCNKTRLGTALSGRRQCHRKAASFQTCVSAQCLVW